MWQDVPVLEVAHFRPESSNHRPRTEARLAYDARGLHGIFRVEDQYVRCVRTGYGAEVWKDSCVEFFVQPPGGRGYFNLEMNCGGAFLICHITNPERTSAGLKEFTKVPAEMVAEIKVESSLPAIVDPEVTTRTVWTINFFVPFGLFEKFIGTVGPVAGQTWRGNFYKCSEDNSHPHWAAWSPVDELNFHLPRCFGELNFESEKAV